MSDDTYENILGGLVLFIILINFAIAIVFKL